MALRYSAGQFFGTQDERCDRSQRHAFFYLTRKTECELNLNTNSSLTLRQSKSSPSTQTSVPCVQRACPTGHTSRSAPLPGEDPSPDRGRKWLKANSVAGTYNQKTGRRAIFRSMAKRGPNGTWRSLRSIRSVRSTRGAVGFRFREGLG